MRIEILGPGCARCHGLEANVRKALEMLGKDAEIVDVTDIQQIMAYGVMATPALVIDGKVHGWQVAVARGSKESHRRR